MQSPIAKETDDSLAIGDLIAGKYRVTRILGRGGMGMVAEAIHEGLGHRVAIKVLRARDLLRAEATARFLLEAKAAAQMKSVHFARVTDVSTLDDGSPYFVMEYLDGQDLDACIAAEGVLPVETAVDYVLQACEALAEAHAAGIVHRDLKPANLFLTRSPDGTTLVKLLDFGISKYTPKGAEAEVSMTQTRALMGSPLYMAPEQMRSTRRVDHRADIWSVGIVLHEVLTGQMPFVGATLPEVCVAIASDDPIAARVLRADVPAGLESIILRCLEKTAERRFSDVAELALALAPYGPPEAAQSVKRITRIIRGLGTTLSLAPPAVVTLPVSSLPPPPSLPRLSEAEEAASHPSVPSVHTFAETIHFRAAPLLGRRRVFRWGALLTLGLVPALWLRTVASHGVTRAIETTLPSHEASPTVSLPPQAGLPPVLAPQAEPTGGISRPSRTAVSQHSSLTRRPPAVAPSLHPKQGIALKSPRPKGPSAFGSPAASASAPDPSGTAAFGGSRE